jgi:M6 family metalloprotease-like protein
LRRIAILASISLAATGLSADPPDAANEAAAVQPPRGLRDTIARIQINSKLATPPGAPVGKRRNQLERIRILVIPVHTADSTGGSPTRDELNETFFARLLQTTDGNRASIADYFRAASYGAVKQVTGQVLDWIKLDQPTGAYFSEGADFPKRAFFEEAFTKADPMVNYAEFDDDKVDGDRGGARNDGFVDIAILVSDCGPGNFNAYRWKMSLMDTPDSPPWNSQDEETLGSPGLGVSENVKVKIDDFIIIPWDRLAEGRIGVAAHEVMHFLGLPDLYNRYDWRVGGVGQWCIMCLGCNEMVQNGEVSDLGPSSRFPPVPTAWCRAQLGWGHEVKADLNGVAKLRSRQESGDYLVVQGPEPTPGVASSEAMYIEYYSPPTKAFPWGKSILPQSTSGFLVWHADNEVGRAANDPGFVWPAAAKAQGQNDATFEWPVGYAHPLLRLVEADGQLSLEKGTSHYSDPAELFTGGSLRLDRGDAGFTWYITSSSPFEFAFDATSSAVQLFAVSPSSNTISTPDSTPTTGQSDAGAAGSRSGRSVVRSVTKDLRWSVSKSGVSPWSHTKAAAESASPSTDEPRPPPEGPDTDWRKTDQLLNKLKRDHAKIASTDRKVAKISENDFQRLGETIQQNGGADGKFAKDLTKVVTLAKSNPSPGRLAKQRDLASVSYGSMENAVELMGSEKSAKIVKSWEQARARTATGVNPAASFYGKYADSDHARLAKTILSPDGTSVVKLSTTDLSLDLLDASPEIDTAKRLWDIQMLTGLTGLGVNLQVDKERTDLGKSGTGTKVYLVYVAHIGEKDVPLNTRDNWGVVSYGDGSRLQNIEFNRPLSVKELPEAAEPTSTAEEIVTSVCRTLGPLAPREKDVRHRLELVLDPEDKTAGRWILAYRIDLPLPSGVKETFYFDANTGERVE